MTTIQYRLYEITLPYVAELVQPKSALKTPQPPPPLILALQHCRRQMGWRRRDGTYVDVPDGLADVVRAGAGADLGEVAADDVVPL
jgi:hypothetical protein